MTTVTKQDSNRTGLRFCEETSLGVLPAAASQIWYPVEPNSYPDFGGQIKKVSRNPINASRQNRKGVTTDLDASGGYNTDITPDNQARLMQGFLFADLRQKYDSNAIGGTPVTDIAVVNSSHEYTSAAFGLAGKHLVAQSLILVSGSADAANNGLKLVSSITADTAIVVSDVSVQDESANPAIELQVVGYEFAVSTASVDVSGALPAITRASGAADWTTLGLIPGEWVYIGGDSSGLAFANAANNGFARVYSVTASKIVFDKTTGTWVTDTGTGKTVQMFFGKVLKNESTPSLIKRRSYQWERDLAQYDLADPDHQGEYLIGSVANQYTLNMKQAEKVTADLTFVSTDYETVDQSTGLKSAAAVTAGSAANAPDVVFSDAFNTSSHVARLRLSPVSLTNGNPSPLFGYVTEFTVVVNNNISPNKAVGVLGAFEVTAGQFDVSGKITAYFADVAAVQAVRNNADVTLDFALVSENKGVVYDLPLLGLDDGRLSVQQNQPITLPLNMNAAVSPTYNHTLLMNFFPYLPNAAA